MTRDIDHWTRTAADWIAWAREPGHDAFWAYRDGFARMVGLGTGPALDIGCGEGRLSRLLSELGYDVTACDPVSEMLEAARAADSAEVYHLATATELPFSDGRFALTLLYNCLMDIEDAEAALVEAARVTAPGGRVVISIVHPIADLLADTTDQPDPNYFSNRKFDVIDEEDGMRMHFYGWARPISFYTDAIIAAGLSLGRIFEPPSSADPGFDRQKRWRRMPLFLWIDAQKPGV